MGSRTNIYLMTDERNSDSTAQNPTFKIQPQLVKSPSQVFEVYISHLQIPYGFNQINANNNALPVTIVVAGVTNNYPNTVLPVGNYNINSFQTAVALLLEELSNFSGLTDPTITFGYNKTSYIQTFSYSSSQVSSITIHCSVSKTMVKMFGSTSDITFNYTGTQVPGNQMFNMQVIPSVAIRSHILKVYNACESTPSGTTTPSNILAVFPVSNNPPYFIVPYLSDRTLFYIGNEVLDRLDLYLSPMDDDYELDQALGWSLALSLRAIEGNSESEVMAKAVEKGMQAFTENQQRSEFLKDRLAFMSLVEKEQKSVLAQSSFEKYWTGLQSESDDFHQRVKRHRQNGPGGTVTEISSADVDGSGIGEEAPSNSEGFFEGGGNQYDR